MATREQLIEDFADHKYATGEKFERLINSMKVVQEPVADPAASGTSLSFIASIEQNADGKITPTKKTLDLSNAHELNPFKGWWKTGDTLPTSGFDGAYLYFKDTTQTPAVTTIYRWNGTTYADTGTVVDESNVQTFGSGQQVNAVYIKNENGEEVQGPADVLSAEAGGKMQKQLGIDAVTYGPEIMIGGNGYIKTDGDIAVSGNYAHSDYIKVFKGQTINVVGKSATTADCLFAAYDDDKIFIADSAWKPSEKQVVEQHQYTMSQDGYVRFSINTQYQTYADVFSAELTAIGLLPRVDTLEEQVLQNSEDVSGLKDDVDDLTDKFYDYKSVPSAKVVAGLMINGEGYIESGVSYRYVASYPVEIGDVIKLKYTLRLDISKTIVYGYSNSETPAVGGTITGYTKHNALELGEQEIIIEVSSAGYLYIDYNSSYVSSVLVSKLTELSILTSNDVDDVMLKQYKANLDGRFLNIAYSVQGEIGNTEPHFRRMIDSGFNALKADMVPSSDGVIMLCHDIGYTLNSEGKITAFDKNASNNYLIQEHTANDIKALEFAINYDGEVVHPCDIDTFLMICKKAGAMPYLTMRNNYNDTQTFVETLFAKLRKFSLLDRTIINIYPAATTTTSALLSYGGSILMCYTIDKVSTKQALKNKADEAKSSGCKYLCIPSDNKGLVDDDVLEKVKGDCDLGLMIYNRSDVEEIIKAGFDGCQNYLQMTIDTVHKIKRNFGYFNCDSARDAKIKVVSAGNDFYFPNHSTIYVKMKYGNTYGDPDAYDYVVLQIGGVQHILMFNSDFTSSSNTWNDGDILEIMLEDYVQGDNTGHKNMVYATKINGISCARLFTNNVSNTTVVKTGLPTLGNPFTFRLVANESYSLPTSIKISMGGVLSSDFTYDSVAGIVVINRVTDNVVVENLS